MPHVISSISDKSLPSLIKEGAVGVLPTDTVYGLVCRAKDSKAVERLYSLKLRENKPGTVIAASTAQLEELGIKARYLKAVEHFWPGSISVVLPFSDPAKSYLRGGLLTLAVRIPADEKLQNLLEQTGPLLTTSANLPGEQPTTTIQEAQEILRGRVKFYVDGGDLSNREPSTIIRIVDDAIEVIREGAVKIDENGRISS